MNPLATRQTHNGLARFRSVLARARVRSAAFALITVAGCLPALGDQHLGRTPEQWRAQLRSSVGVERLLAARAIGEMAVLGLDGARAGLLEALGHSDGSVRYWAAVASAEMPDVEQPLSEALAGLLQDELPEVRVQAARALAGSEHSAEAIAVLRRAFDHPNRGVRLHAAHAADAIGDDARALTDALRKAVGDSFDYVQRVARHALWQLGARSCPYRSCDGKGGR